MGGNTGAGSGYGFDEGPKAQSGTFKRLQQMTDSGQGGIYLSFITFYCNKKTVLHYS